MKKNPHLESVIDPANYTFLAVTYDGSDEFAQFANIEGRLTVIEYLKKGHKFEPNGTKGICHCCGARPSYLGNYIYNPTGGLIHVGLDCALKLDMGDVAIFRDKRDKLVAFKTGKARAKAYLDRMGLPGFDLVTGQHAIHAFITGYHKKRKQMRDNGVVGEAWDVINHVDREYCEPIRIIDDLVRRCVNSGGLSEKQDAFLLKLWDQVGTKDLTKIWSSAKRQIKAKANKLGDPPTGKVTVEGEILSTKTVESAFGGWQVKMLVRLTGKEEIRVWGTCPSKLLGREIKGKRVRFTATFTPQEKGFGFFSRPSQATIIA